MKHLASPLPVAFRKREEMLPFAIGCRTGAASAAMEGLVKCGFRRRVMRITSTRDPAR